jgi:histidine ammonia-lyase
MYGNKGVPLPCRGDTMGAVEALLIDGRSLTLRDYLEVVFERRPVALDGEARGRVRESRAVIERLVESGAAVYGVTTGFGQLSDTRIAHEQLHDLQVNLVRSHASGVGPALDEAESRGMLLLRANVLAGGLSGVRAEAIDLLCGMLNAGIHPLVPSQGSVGASGDLAPLAHLALVMIGEGEACYRGTRLPGGEALRMAGLAPLELQAKEGIGLLNGTQGMLAIGLLALRQAEILADTADVVGALTLDALRGTPAAFDPRIHQARPHPGQIESARNLLRMSEGSEIRESHRSSESDPRLQDAYSLRCMPQVHGAVRDVISHARRVLEIELNSATDNPLVFATGGGEVVLGGNFHGQPVAFALDFLALALTSLAGISERRLERLVNPSLNESLPAFLAGSPGLESGLMISQVVAAALVSENRVLAHPASADSITTSGNKEDFVSMGMGAALKLKRVVANARYVLAAEALAAAQGLEYRAPLRTGPRGRRALELIRSASPPLTRDRSLAPDLEAVSQLIASGRLCAVLD